MSLQELYLHTVVTGKTINYLQVGCRASGKGPRTRQRMSNVRCPYKYLSSIPLRFAVRVTQNQLRMNQELSGGNMPSKAHGFFVPGFQEQLLLLRTRMRVFVYSRLPDPSMAIIGFDLWEQNST